MNPLSPVCELPLELASCVSAFVSAPDLLSWGLSAKFALRSVNTWPLATATDAGIALMAPLLGPGFHTFAPADCNGLTDAGVRQLALCAPGLRTFKATDCHTVTDAFLPDLMTHCPLLQVRLRLRPGQLGGAPCVVRRVGDFRSVFSDGHGDRGSHCVPRHRPSPDFYSMQKLR